MKILVVDDEKLARKRILKILRNEKEVELLEASSGLEAVFKIESELPDIVFLDIQLTDFSGFEVLNRIDPSTLPVIVFVTAYDEYAIKAFEIQAVDYLLKPYKQERIITALRSATKKMAIEQKDWFYHKVHTQLQELIGNHDKSVHTTSDYLDKIVLRLGRKFIFAKTEKIKYITSSTYYAELFMMDGKKHIYRTSMTALMERLNPEDFLRLNRSTIIRIQEIKEIISEGHGDYSVVMMDGIKFHVTKTYKNSFLNQLSIR